MIIINLYHKFKINPLYYIVALITVITGHFKDMIVFTSIIIIHELGHIIAALYYKWNIDEVIILPFGGITVFKESLNKSLFEEFIILLMGPLFQILFYIIVMNIHPSYILKNYHYTILLFNLLPIIPLDGSKFINIISNKFFPFKKSHLITIYVSLLITFSIMILKINNLIFLLIMIFLIIKIISEYNEHDYIFNKFLLERLMYKFNFQKKKIIKGNNIQKIYKGYRHIFNINNKNYEEDEIIKRRFDKSNVLW